MAAGESPLPAVAFMDKQAIIKIYEDKQFRTPLHSPGLGQDLPGSDAPEKPPTPPAEKVAAKKEPNPGSHAGFCRSGRQSASACFQRSFHRS